jgi:hypothetical protein
VYQQEVWITYYFFSNLQRKKPFNFTVTFVKSDNLTAFPALPEDKAEAQILVHNENVVLKETTAHRQ